MRSAVKIENKLVNVWRRLAKCTGGVGRRGKGEGYKGCVGDRQVVKGLSSLSQEKASIRLIKLKAA